MRLLCLALLLLFLTGCGSQAPPAPIYFGHLAPRSGPNRAYGLGTEQGILLAVEEALAIEGQVLGRPVAVLHPDTQADPTIALSLAVRLATVNRVAGLIGGAQPEIEERLCRVLQQDPLPLLTPSWLPSEVLGTCGFSLAAVPADQGKALGEFAVGKLGVKQVLVLVDNRNQGWLAVAEAFTKTVGVKAVLLRGEYASPDQWPALAEQVPQLGSQPDAVLLASSTADLEGLRTLLRKAGVAVKVPLLFGGAADGSMAGSSDLYYTTVFLADESRPQAQPFARKFAQRFGRAPGEAEALTYDAAQLLFEATRRAKALDSAKIIEELSNLKDHEGVTGRISFEKGQAASRPVFVVRGQDGQIKKAPGGRYVTIRRT